MVVFFKALGKTLEKLQIFLESVRFQCIFLSYRVKGPLEQSREEVLHGG